MTALRQNLGWLVGSIATAIAAAISWFVSSEIFITLVSVLVGFLASYLLQMKTQKRAWRREYSIRIVEEVYGALFAPIKYVMKFTEEEGHNQLGFDAWREIQDDYRYYMVDEEFRTKLDEFYRRVESYNKAIYELENKKLPTIMEEEGQRIFKVDVGARELTIRIKFMDAGKLHTTSPDLIKCLTSETRPREYLLKRHPKAEISDLEVLFGQVPAGSSVLEKLPEFLASCQKRMKEDEAYKFVVREKGKLSEEAKNVKVELVKRIREPWEI